MAPYWRYAIELLPKFKKRRIPIARFLCRRRRKTFSLLPIQLIPYFQYTVGAVVGTLFLGMGCWQMGQKGFHGASVKVDEVDPGSLVTPWLITCWLVAVVQGLCRGHAALRQFYNLDGVHTLAKAEGWQEAATYFVAFGLKPKMDSIALLMDLMYRYCRATGQFLFGTPSQYRGSVRP
ncbi:MAG: hypothetical protein AB1502_10525 [Thermodesulfobacteriota bacterium]